MAVLIDYGDDWRSGYVDLVHRLADNPDGAVDSRVGFTHEITDFMFTLSPDAIDLPLGVGRKISTALAAAEAIQLCAGVAMPELTEAVAARVASFVRDKDGTVHGNYGGRVDMQIIDVVDKLRADPMSRQAIIQIWDAGLDSQYRDPMPRDIPCTIAIGLLIRGGALQMSVTMRSNDAWLGTPYDVFQFRQLQRTIARQLGRPIGQYVHHAYSMHLYDKDLGAARGLSVDAAWQPNGPFPDGLYAARAAALPSAMLSCLVGKNLDSESHEWYHARLGEAYARLHA